MKTTLQNEENLPQNQAQTDVTLRPEHMSHAGLSDRMSDSQRVPPAGIDGKTRMLASNRKYQATHGKQLRSRRLERSLRPPYGEQAREFKRWVESTGRRRYGSVAGIAREIGVWPGLLWSYIGGRVQPSGIRRAKLFELTKLASFGPTDGGPDWVRQFEAQAGTYINSLPAEWYTKKKYREFTGRPKSSVEVTKDESLPENRGGTNKREIRGGEAHRFRPGQSGNPGGRPKTGALAKACRELMEQAVPGDPAGRTYAQAIAERLAELSLKGHLSAIRELGDRAEGRAGQLLNVQIRPASDAGELELRPVESHSIEPTLEIGNEDEHLLLP